jgi:hypothetical protein
VVDKRRSFSPVIGFDLLLPRMSLLQPVSITSPGGLAAVFRHIRSSLTYDFSRKEAVLHQSCGVMIAATNSRKISTPSTKALLAEHHSSRHHLLRLPLPTLFYLIPHMINPDCIKLLVRSQLSFAPCGFSSAFTSFNDLASSVVTLFVFIRNEQEKLCSPHPVPREMFFLHSLFWVVRPV